MIFHIGKPWYEGTSAKWESLPPASRRLRFVSLRFPPVFHLRRLDEERFVITDRIHKQMECARHRLCRVHLAVEVPACNVIIVFDVIGIAFVQIILIHAAFVAEQTDCLEFVLLDVACP